MRRFGLASLVAALVLAGCAGAGSTASVAPAVPAGPTGPTASPAPTTSLAPPASAEATPPAPSYAFRPTPQVIGTPFPTSPAASIGLVTVDVTTHVTVAGIGFDMPSTWSWRPANISEHYIQIVGFAGTAPSGAYCVPVSAKGTMCGTDLNLGPGTVTIQLTTHDGPIPIPLIADDPHRDPTDRVIAIDGVAALLGDGPGASGVIDGTRTLALDAPNEIGLRLRVQASVRGPNADGLLAQVDAIFGSVHYDPAIVPLPTDAATKAAIARKAVIAIQVDPAQRCFPLRPGTEHGAWIGQLPGYSPVGRAVRVTCRTDIAGTPNGVWRLTLTIRWGARGDSSKSWTEVVWLLRDGTPSRTMSTGAELH